MNNGAFLISDGTINYVINGFEIFLLIILTFIFFKKLKNLEKNILNNTKPKKLDLSEAEKAKQFLDKIIRDKFEYYLATEILPVYKVGKTLDKKQVNELKEQFFIDVSYFLNKNVKNILKSYFNTEAIKIYIIEKFFTNLNKVDMTFFEELNINEKDIEKMIKD